MRRNASSIRSTSRVSPTPSIELGTTGPARERSTFSMSSISFSSGVKRGLSTARFTSRLTPAAASASSRATPAPRPATAATAPAASAASTALSVETWLKRALLRTGQA
jgi:hypothetical protein